MTLRTPQTVVTTGTTPSTFTPTVSDTIPGSTAGPNGWFLRVTTSGTATTVKTTDPGFTPISNPGNPAGVVMPSTGTSQILIPRGAIDNTGVVGITFTSITGVTCELYAA
jgi:hypothetical protein